MAKRTKKKDVQAWDITARELASCFGFKPEHFGDEPPRRPTLVEELNAASWETFHLAQDILFACDDAGFYNANTGKFLKTKKARSKGDKALIALAHKAKALLNTDKASHD